MPKAISEEIKQKIAYLSEQETLSETMIAQALGVSERTVRRYKKMVSLGRPRPDNNGRDSPAVDRPNPHCLDKASEPTGRPRPDNNGQYEPNNRIGWICKRCGYFTAKTLKYCLSCGCGPFTSIFVEIGSPEHKRWIEEKQKRREKEEHEYKEVYDSTKNYWICRDCDNISNNEFRICPDCGSRAVEFAPDGIEPRDSSKYQDLKPQNDKDAGFPDNEESEEEETQDYQWECPNCHQKWNGNPDQCPKCGILLE